MKNSKVMAAFATTLVALSLVGIAFAGWTDQVTIEGVAEMGEFIVGILVPDDGDAFEVMETTNGYPEEGPAPQQEEPGGFTPKPWVANTYVYLDDFRTSVHHDPPQTVAHYMNIFVENAYPQYDAHVWFMLKNAGTIPAHIRCIFGYATVESSLDGVPRDLVMTEEGWEYDGVSWVNSGTLYDPERLVDVILWKLVLTVPIGQDPTAVQLEPCNEYPAEIHFEFTQDAEECHVYKWGFLVDAIQWNKAYEWYVP